MLELLPPSGFTAARVFHSDTEEPTPTRDRFAVECRDSCVRLVPFHFHETEAFALAGEDVMGQVDGANGSELTKKVSDVTFPGLGWQITYKHFEHGHAPWRIAVRCRTKK
jgi:hypothetical protein